MSSKKPDTRPDGPIASFRSPELRVIFAVTLMAVLGVASIAPALPKISSALGLTPAETGLLITAFTLPGVFLTPFFGMLADRIGRRRVLVPALLLFAIAGAACFLVRSFPLLLALRVLQGVGASPLGALNVTLIGDLFSGRQRTAAMGYNASVLSMGTATYPAVGGALAALAWYAPFSLPLLALPVAALVAWRLPAEEPLRQQSLARYLGGVWREVRRRQVLALYVASTVIFILLYGAYITFLPFLMAERFAAGPLVIGLAMAGLSLVTAGTSSQLGRLARRFSEAAIIRAGFVVFAAGLATIPLVKVAAAMALPSVLLGVAFATTIPIVMSLLTGLVPDDRRAAVMSLNGTVLRLGQTVGPLAMAAVWAAGGIDAVFLVGAVLALAMAALMAWALRAPPAGTEEESG